MTPESSSLLMSLSQGLAEMVQEVAPSVVRVDDGSRLTATGIVWTADGVIVTTSHGVEHDDDLAIELADGTRHAATLVGRDPSIDLAVLRVNAAELPPVQRAQLEEIQVGHLVVALARPGTSGLQATIGIISARQDSQTDGHEEYILYTDAVLYPGFSGGPLVNTSGQVVGLNDRMFGRGVGVALGIPIIAHVADELLVHGRVRRGYLGIGIQPVVLQESLRNALSLKQERALLIVQVKSESPADQGDLMIGDTLLSINDQSVQDVDDLRRHVQADQTVALRILRGGEVRVLDVKIGIEE
ncbi:MAG: S1C family serine protease [Anaerolineae bacterium]